MFSRLCILLLTLLATATTAAELPVGPKVYKPEHFTPDSAGRFNPGRGVNDQRLYDSIRSKTSRRRVPRMLYRMLFVRPVLDTTATGQAIDESVLLEPFAGRRSAKSRSTAARSSTPTATGSNARPTRRTC